MAKNAAVLEVLILAYFLAFARCTLREGTAALPILENLHEISQRLGPSYITATLRHKSYEFHVTYFDEKTGAVSGIVDLAQPLPQAPDQEERPDPSSPEFWIIAMTALLLTLFGGLMSGLTVGYLSIDSLVLELKLKNGTETEKKNALVLLSVLENQHHLLVTLLVANSAAMEALPIFLNMLVPELVAVVISVTAVLIFGEVIPQAVCTGPNQITIAAKVAPLTKCLMIVESIIAYPLSKILDLIMGEHNKSRYNNTDLKALIELHSENAIKDILEHGNDADMGLSVAQTKLINGTIDLVSAKASDVMTPYDKVATVSDEQIVDEAFIKRINSMGYSRFPIYKGSDRHQILGMLLIKKLVGVGASNKTISELNIPLRKPLVIPPTMSLTDLLMEFRKGKSHMALVTQDPSSMQKYLGLDAKNSVINNAPMVGSIVIKDSEIMGIVTLENVIEKAMGGEILDEVDYDKSRREELKATMDTAHTQRNEMLRRGVPNNAKRLFVESLIEFESEKLHDMIKEGEARLTRDLHVEPVKASVESNEKYPCLINASTKQ